MKKHKKDLLLVLIILIIAAAGFGITSILHKKPAALLEIAVNGQIIQTLDLSQDTELTIEGAGGGTNHLIVKDGMAWIDEASCPDKVCIHQGKIMMNRQMIVCLPNQMTATIRAEETSNVYK